MSAHPILTALALYVIALLVIWALDTKATRDPGGYTESLKNFLDGFHKPPFDKAWHASICFALGAVTAFYFKRHNVEHHWRWSVGLVMLAGVGLELIEWRPRHAYAHGKRGRFSAFDLMADFLGGALGAAIGALV